MSTIGRAIRATSLVAVFVLIPQHAGHAQHEEHQHPTVAAAADVTGIVLCADGPALAGAVVQLFGNVGNEGKLHASTLTDAAGRFRLRIGPGTYRLQITFLGHSSIDQVIEIQPNARVASLGTLRLPIAAIEVDALIAAAEQDRIRMQSGFTTFDVRKSGTVAGGTVADVIRTVPNLEINEEGNVSIRGSSSVLVLINGRRTVLKGDGLTAFLKQMPASALEKIEVSTTASAKQDAEGFAGVVNLQFNTSRLSPGETGLAVAASGATAGQFMASTSANGGGGLLNWDAMYAASVLTPATYSHTMRDNGLAADALRTSHQESNADARHVLHSVSAGATLGLNARNSLTGRFAYSWMKGTFDNTTEFADIAESGTQTNASLTNSRLEHTIPTLDASVSWSYTDPDRPRMRWSTELRYADSGERFDGSYRRADAAEFLATDMDLTRGELVFQNDLGFDLRGFRIEAGHKTQRRDISADFVTARSGFGESERLEFLETVNAGYVSVSRSFGSTFAQAGLRVEGSSTELRLTDHAGRDNNDVRVFPSMALHWPHDRQSAMQYQLSYGHRIQRPDAASLNPFAMGEDDMNSFIGNPLLRPEITDQLELAVIRRFDGLTLQFTPYVRATSDPIRPIKAVSAAGQATTTLQNMTRSRAAGLDMSLSARVQEKVSVLISANSYYGETEGAAVQTEGVYVNLRGSVDIKVTPQTTVQLYASRRSAQPIEQGEILPAATGEVALTRRFGADNRGSLTFRVSDPFNTSKLAFYLDDSTFRQRSERKVTSRMLSAFVSWSLGVAKVAEPSRPDGEPPPRIF